VGDAGYYRLQIFFACGRHVVAVFPPGAMPAELKEEGGAERPGLIEVRRGLLTAAEKNVFS